MKKYVQAVNYNVKHIFYYELILKLISFFVFIPLFKFLNNYIIYRYNIKYITLGSLRYLLTHISFDLFLILFLLLLSLYFIFDYTSIILIVHKGLDKEKLNYLNIFKESFIKTIKVFLPKNILFLLYSFVLFVFINLGLVLIAFNYIDFFNIMLNMIFHDVFSTIIFINIALLLIFLTIIGIFGLHNYVIHDMSFIESFRNKNIFVNIKTIILVLLRKIIPFALVLCYLIGSAELFFYIKTNITGNWLSISEGLIIASIVLLLFYYYIKTNINDVLFLSCCYYKNTNEKVSVFKDRNQINKYYKYIMLLGIIIINIIFIVIMFNVNNNKIKYNFVYDFHVDITGHRGAFNYAPENTMASFETANAMNVQYIELDVQPTKDGYIFVMHDASLKRTLGINKKGKNATWAEINDVPVISNFPEYKNETVPLFEDVIKWAKNKDFILNIEIKSDFTDYTWLDQLIDIIHKYNYQDKCIIASFDIDAIRRIRALDETIPIVSLGNYFVEYEGVDYYSINYTSISSDMVNYVHSKGQKVFAWTVNDPDIVRNMMNMNVDNIITNDPPMVKEVIDNYKNKNKVNELFNFLSYIF